jgi:hypothetical protein
MKNVQRDSRAAEDTTAKGESVPDFELKPAGMSHADLVARAVAWLRNTQNCRVVLAEQSALCGEIPDAIGWKYGHQSHLVEVKVSRSDFMADRAKSFRIDPKRGMGMFRYFMVPAGLIKVEDLGPSCDRWGLLEVRGRTVGVLRKAEHFHEHNSVAELHLAVQALAQAQLRVAEPLHQWLSGPGSPVAALRENRRQISRKQREIDLECTCSHVDFDGGVERSGAFERCNLKVATGHRYCSAHGGRTRGEKRPQKQVTAAFEESRAARMESEA